MNRTLRFYRDRLKWKAKKLNYIKPLQDYFLPMINGKTVIIADLGSGPFSLIGTKCNGIEIKVVASDILANEYNNMMRKANIIPVVPVEYQNMEELTYDDELFDIVHCVNALDHTKDAEMALMEMYRVCKLGGWIYLRHFPNSGKRWGYKRGHFWNITKDGEIGNEDVKFPLPNFTTKVEGDMLVSKRPK